MTCLAVTGASRIPSRKCPVATKYPGVGVAPRIGSPSGVPGRSPAHASRIARVGQFRNQINRRLPQFLDRLRHRLLVESRFFHGRPDHHAPVAARDQVNVRRAHHVAHQFLSRHGNAQHLPFDGPRREPMRPDLPRPGSGAIHHDARGKLRLVGADAGSLAGRHFHGQHLVAGRKINAAMRAAAMAAAVRSRGSTQRSFTNRGVRRGVPFEIRSAGSSSASGRGRR
jgi:hypothetical protein